MGPLEPGWEMLLSGKKNSSPNSMQGQYVGLAIPFQGHAFPVDSHHFRTLNLVPNINCLGINQRRRIGGSKENAPQLERRKGRTGRGIDHSRRCRSSGHRSLSRKLWDGPGSDRLGRLAGWQQLPTLNHCATRHARRGGVEFLWDPSLAGHRQHLGRFRSMRPGAIPSAPQECGREDQNGEGDDRPDQSSPRPRAPGLDRPKGRPRAGPRHTRGTNPARPLQGFVD